MNNLRTTKKLSRHENKALFTTSLRDTISDAALQRAVQQEMALKLIHSRNRELLGFKNIQILTSAQH